MRLACKPPSVALLLALLTFATGCDSNGGDADEARPTVRFTAPGMSVTEEDGAVAVGVTISGSPDAAVTVEVLFADSASTADADDIGSFQAEAVTFEAGAAAGTVREVTFNVVADGDGAETAYFALQRLSGPARLGEPREFALRIGQNIITLAALREGGVGTTGTVKGIVTEAEGDFTRIQDGTGGLTIRQTDGAFAEAVASGAIAPGDSIVVTGETSEFNGLLQVNDEALESFEVTSRGNPLPEPAVVALDELSANGDRYESTLIRVEDFVIDDPRNTFVAGGAEGNFSIAGVSNVELRLPSGSVYAGQPVPRDPVTFEGILGQFNNFQLLADDEGTLIFEDGGGGGGGGGEVVSIATAREADGQVVFEGIVTRASGDFTYVEDETAAITIRQTSGDFFDDVADGSVEPGDRLRITGTPSRFRGLTQINNEDLTAYEVVAEDAALPEPQAVTLAEIQADGEDYEAELVEVEGLTIAADGDETFQAGGGAGNYTVTGPDGNTLTLRIPDASFYKGEPIPEGTVTFTGVLGQFDSQNNNTDDEDGYQLTAIAEGDIEETDDGGGSDVVSIATARGMVDDGTVTIEGIVTSLDDDEARVQDETAGIFISRREDFAEGVERGDRVRITGNVSEFANQTQIDSDDLLNFEVLSSDNDLPEATTLASLDELDEEYESERVRVEGVTISPDGGDDDEAADGTFKAGGSEGNYTITDADGNTRIVRIPSNSFYEGEPIPEGEVTIEGVGGQFSFDDPSGGYQILVRYEGTITEEED